MLEALKSGRKNIGVKQSVKAVESGIADCVFIANDADARVTANLKELCEKSNVRVIYVDTMKQLGKACGIEVDAAAACLLKND